MKKIYNLLIVLTVPALLMLYSYSGGSPGGKTGSPGDGGANCTQCHSGAPQSASSWISTNIPLEGYTPGQSYTITLTGTHPGVSKFGFELTSEDNFGNKFGTLAVLEPSRTKLVNGGHAVTHTSGGTTPQGNSNTWTMQWTAPAAGGSPVKFYAALNAANGNGNTSGDVIYLTSKTVNQYIPPVPEITSVDPSEAQQGWTGQVTVTGQNTSWSGSPAVLFKFHDDHNIVISADSVTVQSNTSLVAGFSIPEDAQVGKYDVFVDDLVLENGFTVDIYDLIGEEEGNFMQVYPNPVTSFVNITAPVHSDIRIFDGNGREVQKTVALENKTTLQLEHLPKGIYFVSVVSGAKREVRKILKR